MIVRCNLWLFEKNGIGKYICIALSVLDRLVDFGENGAIPWESNQIRPFIIKRRFTNQNNIQRWLPSAENQELLWIQVRKELLQIFILSYVHSFEQPKWPTQHHFDAFWNYIWVNTWYFLDLAKYSPVYNLVNSSDLCTSRETHLAN